MATNATFGTVEHRESGILVVPVTFAENVIAAAKTVFPITHISGDALTGLDYYLIGKDTDFEIIVTVPPDRSGRFQVAANGDVLLSTGSWENVVATAVVVNYSTAVPRIVDFDVPAGYTPGENFDVKLAYNTLVTGLSDNNVQDVFILEGAANMMGTPTPYKWTGAEPTNLRTFLQTAAPDDLTGTNWQQLQSPPAGVPQTADNDFDEDGFWHGAANQGKYFLVRFTVQDGATGIFSMTPRIGVGLRGPVS